MFRKTVKIALGGVLGSALLLSSTVASAASASRAARPVVAMSAPLSISPFVALSAYGTMQSRNAVCATAIGAAGAAAASGQAAPGCVLPVLDPVVPVAVEAPIAVPVAAIPVAAGFGLGLGALLAGLVAVAGIAALLTTGSNGGDRLPISPD